MSTSPVGEPSEPIAVPAWLELDGVVNMRDLGGLPVAGGGTTSPGRLIRSDNLQDLAPSAVRHLVDDLGVTTVVDLRTHVEVAKEGDGPLVAEPGVEIVHLTLYREDSPESGIPAAERELPWKKDRTVGDEAGGSATTAAGVAATAAGDAATAEAASPPDRHDRFWSQHYLGYLQQRPDHVLAALRTIAQAPGAVVVHCAAGKDRTGTVVGLALALAGVEEEAVVADFAASAERVPQILARLTGRPAYATNLEGKTVDQQSPRSDTMRILLDVLDREYGGVAGWLGSQRLSAEEVDRLRDGLRTKLGLPAAG